MNAARLQRVRGNLKRAWHEATFLQGPRTPAAKHLFNAIDAALREIDSILAEQVSA
jgi:hypothetical protein